MGWPCARCHRLGWVGVLVGVSGFLLPAVGEELPLPPYPDPTQLVLEWPLHSHLLQPWRGYCETRVGVDFAHGVGINLNVSEDVDLAARLLSEAGFRAARIELGWGQVSWDETGLLNEEAALQRLRACRMYGLRPTVLLNAHHGVPCPCRFVDRHVAAPAEEGAREVVLDSVEGLEPGYSGLCNLTTYMANEVFFTEIDPRTGRCVLSRPLPRALEQGERVAVATLKYLPAHPVGTPEFEAMAKGWVRYVELVLGAVEEAGIGDFDVEIWNELSFGSAFMGTWGINHYYDPPLVEFERDFLHPGGHAWEVARRTVERVKAHSDRARCIWGFSNTTFFHVPIAELPLGVDGQSYHPYGTGVRRLPEQEQAPQEPWRCREGWVPSMEICMPEGWAHTFIQTESLMRLLNPEARQQHAEGRGRFYHYMTEHGVVPAECGVTEVEGGWDLKARCAVRSFVTWLGKGIDVMHYYCAYDADPLGMGLLPTNLDRLPADAAFNEVATPPMRALRNLTRVFSTAEPVTDPVHLSFSATALEPGRVVVEGRDGYPPLLERDLLALVPFQLGAERFCVAIYVMTYDYRTPMPPMRYRLVVEGLPMGTKVESFYDPLSDEEVPARVLEVGGGRLVVEVEVTDMPRMLMLGAAG